MASFFHGLDDEAASWNVPNPIEWMTTGSNSRNSSFSSITSKQNQEEASISPPKDRETTSVPRSHQDVTKDEDVALDTECSRTADDSSHSTLEEEREIFHKAREYLHPSFFFRFIIQLYAQRKMNVFFLVHFMSTMVIWAHFALIKFEEQAEAVPVGANRYWLKRMAPTLEFGSMHAILFQMALLPITMCRLSISTLAESVANRIVPFNRTLRMHIHLGYTMITIVVVATLFFFFFFGILCAEGEQAFCDNFTMEIMITGYLILGFLLIIGATSFYRHKIPYEAFYYIHHLVFILYIVTILHTFDGKQRSGDKQRSQTFKWFTSSILYYVCDRVAMRLNHLYRTKMVASSVVWGSNGSKLVILKVQRPSLFQFKPGQYAFIKIDAIDGHWHPFSIASHPNSPYLEFYIEVFDRKKKSTWTKQLWYMMNCECGDDKGNEAFSLKVDVMGPYGTSLTGDQSFSNIVAVGAGTGVVPILSMYKEHMHSVLRLNPDKYFVDLKASEIRAHAIEIAEDQRKGSLMKKLATAVKRCCCSKQTEGATHETSDRLSLTKTIRQSIVKHSGLESKKQLQNNMRDMKQCAQMASSSIYGTVFLSFLPVVGITLFSLMISWSTIPIDIYPGMTSILKLFTVFFQACFAITSLFFWNVEGILSYVDVVMMVLSPFADWYWSKKCDEQQRLDGSDIALFSFLIWYMIIRLWIKAVGPNESSWYSFLDSTNRPAQFDKMTFIWTTRSASQASEILPDVVELWNTLVKRWGHENAKKVCDVSVYITDPDDEACALLQKEFENTDFFRSGAIRRGRASMKQVIEDHTIEMINTKFNSHSLLAFCGSPQLAREIHRIKISNDMITAMTGNCQSHVMDFVSESYGGVDSSEKKKKKITEKYGEEDSMELLTNRKTVVMDNTDHCELIDSSVTSFWI